MAEDQAVSISWSSVVGATSYNIYWSTSPGVSTSDNPILNQTSPHTHSGLTNGTTYYYVVTALNPYGQSIVSSEVEATPQASGAPPDAPATVSAVAGDQEVSVSWSSVAGATSYNIYWSTSSGVTTSDNQILDRVSPYTHSGLTNGTTYYYVVTALNAYGESMVSSEAMATPQAIGTPPTPPTNISAVAGNGEITISWFSSTGATSYNIYWDTLPGVTSSDFSLTGVTSPYTHPGRTNGTTYYYVVTAVNTYGESGVSVEVSATPSASWAKTYGGSLIDTPRSIRQTQDDGYIVAGDTMSFGAGDRDAWIMKLNTDGSVMWERTFGGIWSDRADSVQQTTDGGYIVGGYHGVEADAWVLKLNSNGTTAWQKAYDNTLTSYSSSIQQTTDDGFIVGGWVDYMALGSREYMALKLDSEGNVEWQKVYTDTSTVLSIQQTSDGGYIALGNASLSATDPFAVWLLKLDSGGSVSWLKTYTTGVYDYAYAIQQTTDGGYVLAGLTQMGAGGQDAWVLKLASDGAAVWAKAIGGTGDDFLSSIQQTSDGGYIATGITESFGTTGSDAWALKLDSAGAVTWQKKYAGTATDGGTSIQSTSDGGYVVAAHTNSSGAGGLDYWILKLDENGALGCGLDGDTTAVASDTTILVGDQTTSETVLTPTVINTTLTGVGSSAIVGNQCH